MTEEVNSLPLGDTADDTASRVASSVNTGICRRIRVVNSPGGRSRSGPARVDNDGQGK